MKKGIKSLKITVALAFLVALSIILGKYLAIRGGDIMRFSLENMPIIFAGMTFGPIAGLLVGAIADIIGCIMVGYTINPLVTVGAAAIGFISGIIPALLKGKKLDSRFTTAITVILSHLVGSVVIKTLGLAAYYDMPLGILLLWRILNYLIVGLLDGAVIYVLMKNKGVELQLAKLKEAEK
ncbi:MAG: folate family ECF transporter S component [Clostridia bacterium]|nr:folate family ECF transporter S component [Clostridia bacterium]